ncbi:hypothetical protein HRI_004093200 [Hibiscus trionum]|uniref:non-specific serine/threonine protein kinase n=1 Tax=Hibiscus trionum TaxID=183268 RepID=A0A9W7MLS8_HIBTR|nr:hypothetical protein HRI_004093200 [Hibiscus trionum]
MKTTCNFTIVCIFIMTNITTKVAVSQASKTNCTIDFEFKESSNSSNGNGNWGGFLNENRCGTTINGYLKALSIRANRTGFIFLDLSEQTRCLNSMKRFEHVSICGIKKLTSGGGGCSDYSTVDVEEKLGNELRSLSENCRVSCGSCVESWESIYGGSHSEESMICRIAVLVALTSLKAGDDNNERIYNCLSRNTGVTADKDESTTEEDGEKKLSKVRTGTWILVGTIVGFLVIKIIIIIILSKRCCKSRSLSRNHAFEDVLLKKAGCPKFPIKEVFSATNSLDESNCIGEGTAGKVYKGILSDQQQVAIKHIVNDGNVETFVREVRSLSHIKHPNLVRLLGYCLSKQDCFLIYELCPNGNLAKWLFGKDKVLSWIERLEIAIGSARGLRFLHTYSEGCIVHRDIKPTNILLGQNLEPKLSDFGLSKLIDNGENDVSSEVRGTFGYVDPEYRNNRRVNSSGDVFSFGVVLLQILSGKKVFNLSLEKPMPLNKMARIVSRGGSVKEFADPKLEGEYSNEAFDITFKLALSCTWVKQQRPTMEQVVVNLEKALHISTMATASSPHTYTQS